MPLPQHRHFSTLLDASLNRNTDVPSIVPFPSEDDLFWMKFGYGDGA